MEVVCYENSADKELFRQTTQLVADRHAVMILHFNSNTAYFDIITLLGAIFIKQTTRSCGRHKQDGFEGNLSFSGEVDVSQWIITFLKDTFHINEYMCTWALATSRPQ